MNFNDQNSYIFTTTNTCVQPGGWRHDYNRDVAACTSQIAAVEEQLDLTRRKITGDNTKCPFIKWDAVKNALLNTSFALTKVEDRLAERPPAMPPGATIPADMRDQVSGSSSDEDVVVAHYIPQSKLSDILFNRIVPLALLEQLGPPLRGKNGASLYCAGTRRLNTRAVAHLEDETASIFGHVYWVPEPLETRR
jgi:hypothetical protein